MCACSLQEGLVNVGWMDCTTQAELCDSFEVTGSSTAFFPPGSTLKDRASVLVSPAPGTHTHTAVHQP